MMVKESKPFLGFTSIGFVFPGIIERLGSKMANTIEESAMTKN
jgi:hypothetical protein